MRRWMAKMSSKDADMHGSVVTTVASLLLADAKGFKQIYLIPWANQRPCHGSWAAIRAHLLFLSTCSRSLQPGNLMPFHFLTGSNKCRVQVVLGTSGPALFAARTKVAGTAACHPHPTVICEIATHFLQRSDAVVQ